MVYFLLCDGCIIGVVRKYTYSRKFGSLVDYTPIEENVDVTGCNMDLWDSRLTIECLENPYSDFRDW